MANLKTLKTVGVVITGVTGVLAWYNSCKSCVSIEDDDATSVAIGLSVKHVGSFVFI